MQKNQGTGRPIRKRLHLKFKIYSAYDTNSPLLQYFRFHKTKNAKHQAY